MARFFIIDQAIELPGVPILPVSRSRDETAWAQGVHVTVRLLSPLAALRIHTNGNAYEEREASESAGAWVAIGDLVLTASQIAGSRAVPAWDPASAVAFTHVNEAVIPAQCIVNIGIAAAKFGGAGGGFQAEHVSGPPFCFIPLAGRHWHAHAGRA